MATSTGVSMKLRYEILRARWKLRNVKGAWAPRAILKLIGLDLLAWIDKNFRDEGTEKGWAPLSPATIRRRRVGPKASRAHRILQDTGTLKRSFVPGPISIKVDERIVTVGTNVEYAQYHEEGRGHNPRRRILPSTRAAREVARTAIRAYVNAKLAPAGRA